jgi:spermidine synthase
VDLLSRRPTPLDERLARVRIGEDDGRIALLVDGVVQSLDPDSPAVEQGYWSAMLPNVRPEQALILGLGGGTLAHLLHRRVGPVPVVGVDSDTAVVDLVRALEWLDLPGLRVEVADAFEYVYQTRERFDFVAVDLFRGGHFQRAALSRPFLRRLRGLGAGRGRPRIALNLFHDHRQASALHRIGTVLEVQRTVRVGLNLVVHAS